MEKRIADVAVVPVAVTALARPVLRAAALRCAASALGDFFGLQFRAAWAPGRVRVTSVDHPLDDAVPFQPRRVAVYLDFVFFWIRAAGYLSARYGRRADAAAAAFIDGMGELYRRAAAIYRANLSTTRRPVYLARPRFLVIHLADPHLLCVPSLHVMVAVRAYTHFRALAAALAADAGLGPGADAERAAELRAGALAIVESVLYVKQHSVNCLPAAFYAMTRYDPELFPPEEAEAFIADLFASETVPAAADAASIRAHILALYRGFVAAESADWRTPILDFLRGYREPPREFR
jgi:hypothetical protein